MALDGAGVAAIAVGIVLCCLPTLGSDVLWRRVKNRYEDAINCTPGTPVSSVHLAGVFIGLLIGGGVGCAIAYGASDEAVLTTPGLTTIVVCLGIAACCSGFCMAFARWEYGMDEEDNGCFQLIATMVMLVGSGIAGGALATIVVCGLWFGLEDRAKRGDAPSTGSESSSGSGSGTGSDTGESGVDGQAIAIVAGVVGGLAWLTCMGVLVTNGMCGQGLRAVRRRRPRPPRPPMDHEMEMEAV